MTIYLNQYFKTTNEVTPTFYVLRRGTHILSLSEVNIYTGELVPNGRVIGVYIEKSDATKGISKLLDKGELVEVDGNDLNPYGIGLFSMIRDTRDGEVYVVNKMSPLSSQVVNFNNLGNRKYTSGTRSEVLESLTRDLAQGIIVRYEVQGGK